MNKSKSIKIRVTEDEYNLIVLKARTEKVNLSEYIRQSAINRRIALPALDIAENQRVTCRPFDEEETYTGIVKADINGRLYIENSAEGSQTAKRETTGNPWAGFCGVVSLRTLRYSHKVKNKTDYQATDILYYILFIENSVFIKILF